MAMKSPPGSISPPAGCRELFQNHPELGFEMTACRDDYSENNGRLDVFNFNVNL